MSKTKKLTKSLENSAALLNTSQQRLEIETNYHTKKLQLMEQDITNKEAFMEKKLKIYENILKEIKDIKDILMKK